MYSYVNICGHFFQVNTVVSLYLWFRFRWFQLPTVNLGPKILNSIPSSMMKLCTILFCPAWDVNYPFVKCIHILYVPLLVVT